MHALLFFALPIAVWGLVLLGYGLLRVHRDRIDRRSTINKTIGSA
jgi:hypothetical protein